MPVYDIELAKKFAEVSAGVVDRGLKDAYARRAAAYISRLSIELSLKAFLECAGLPVEEIRKHSHNLRSLLTEVDKCEVEIELTPGHREWVPASRVRSIDIGFDGYSTSLGVIIDAEDHGASVYPNELRYGDMPKDFPPEALAVAAVSLADWVGTQVNTSRRQ